MLDALTSHGLGDKVDITGTTCPLQICMHKIAHAHAHRPDDGRYSSSDFRFFFFFLGMAKQSHSHSFSSPTNQKIQNKKYQRYRFQFHNRRHFATLSKWVQRIVRGRRSGRAILRVAANKVWTRLQITRVCTKAGTLNTRVKFGSVKPILRVSFYPGIKKYPGR